MVVGDSQRAISDTLAEYVTGLKYGDLPAEVVDRVRLAVLDQLGCQLAGSTLEWNKIPYRFITDFGDRPESTIVNYGDKALAHDAAYVNGSFGQGAEIDDYMSYKSQPGGHAGALCVPVALSLGEKNHIGGQEVLTSIAIGYQMALMLGLLMMPALSHRGFHAQGVCGVFMTTAVAGKLLGLKPAELCHAFGIAGSHASGTMEYDQSGGEVKRVHTGIAIRNGMQSAMLASYGLTGPLTIFEGKRGICTLFAGQCNTEDMLKGLHAEWGVMHTAVKSYACVGTLQSSIDVMARLMAEHRFTAAQVQKINVRVGENVLGHGGTIVEPKDAVGAQFSLAYSLAIRLLNGSNDLDLYLDERLWRDPQVLALARKVEVRGDPTMKGDRRRASDVTVTLTDGKKLHGEALVPKGVPENPFTKSELMARFHTLASRAIPKSQAERIAEMVEELEKLNDVSGLMPLLVSQREARA